PVCIRHNRRSSVGALGSEQRTGGGGARGNSREVLTVGAARGTTRESRTDERGNPRSKSARTGPVGRGCPHLMRG
ncbi:MAG: hypothetical protein IJP45_07395, partial [Paludibacteraceae bacterium]|nr:hypothetical protein [Paludibacteraceae bacterium]